MVHELRYTLTSADQVEAAVAGMVDTDMMRRAVRNSRIASCLGFGVAAALAWSAVSAPVLAVSYVAMGLLGVVFSRRLVTSSYRRRLAKVASRDGLGSLSRCTTGITDAGLCYDGEAGSGLIKWPEFRAVYESANTYALKMSGTTIFPIPKRTESGDAAAFIAEVRQRSGF